MKKIATLFFTALIFVNCATKKEIAKVAEVELTPEQEISTIKNYSLTKGTIHWTGSKVAYDHRGTINVSAGTISANGNTIEAGEFIIDMSTITNTDLPADTKPKLEGHLKSADFFDVAKFPTAAFTFISAKPIDSELANFMITGSLTMKGISRNVSFPALVIADTNGKFAAVSDKFTINRTDWNINYSSSVVGTIADKLISDDIKLQIEISAK